MPRQPRLIILGYPYHIVLRGNNRSAIFYHDKDRRFFLECLKISKEKTQSKIYAYCLMDNHAHFLIEPSSETGLAEMMQSLGRRYVPYFNSNYKRTGTLWEGRYKSSLVDRDEYFAACIRYIELNPVRAQMVNLPGEYSWSSFQPKATGEGRDILDKDFSYLDIGKTDIERQANYSQWVMEGIAQSDIDFIRKATKTSGIIGNAVFRAAIEKAGLGFGVRPFGV